MRWFILLFSIMSLAGILIAKISNHWENNTALSKEYNLLNHDNYKLEVLETQIFKSGDQIKSIRFKIDKEEDVKNTKWFRVNYHMRGNPYINKQLENSHFDGDYLVFEVKDNELDTKNYVISNISYYKKKADLKNIEFIEL